jgi:iron only hydrogenase large subunit-like protein
MKREAIVEIDVCPTPEELAEAFWMLNGDEQAKFFNYLAAIGLPHGNFSTQMHFLSSSSILSDDGRYVMHQIGSYSEKSA